MAINVYLNFRGDCMDAVNFYTEVFGTPKKEIMTYGQVDHSIPMDDKTKDLILHTELTIFGDTVMFSDITDDMPFTVGNNVTLVITLDDEVQMDAVFNKLKQGGNVVMELQSTFWSKRYGFVIDRFGIGWQLSHSQMPDA